MSEIRDELAAVLAAHEYMLQLNNGAICRCGHVPTVRRGSLLSQQDHHRAHLAEALAAYVAGKQAEAVREFADRFRPGDGNPWALYVRARAHRTADRIEQAGREGGE